MIPTMQLGGLGRGRPPVVVAGVGDPFFANVVSLLHFDGADASTTFTDVKGKAWTASGNAQIDTAQSKFGGAAGLFDSNGDYVTTPSHADFSLGAGDFTIELWLRIAGTKPENMGIVVRDSIGGTRGWLFFTQASTDAVPSAVSFTAWVGGTSYLVADSAAITAGAWDHFSAVRDGGTLRLYKNGVQVSSVAITGTIGEPAEPCVIGNLWGVGIQVAAATSLNGWVDDLRITKGVCRYPSGTTFTPPTSAFPDS